MRAMVRRLRRAAAAASVAAFCALAAPVLPSSAAAKSTTCNVMSLYEKPGYPSYVTSLEVRGASCATGTRLVKAYYQCRVRSGGPFSGRCHYSVLGFGCHEQRQGISFLYYATVTCRHGPATVIHTYQQQK